MLRGIIANLYHTHAHAYASYVLNECSSWIGAPAGPRYGRGSGLSSTLRGFATFNAMACYNDILSPSSLLSGIINPL